MASSGSIPSARDCFARVMAASLSPSRMDCFMLANKGFVIQYSCKLKWVNYTVLVQVKKQDSSIRHFPNGTRIKGDILLGGINDQFV
jgi:hypothetical protein